MEKILPIINGESTVSLRLVDWFATNYSKTLHSIFIKRYLWSRKAI